MKANSIGSFLRVLGFVALAGVLAPRVATAQQDESGKFTLPVEVRWGTAVLPAGDYRFSTDSLTAATKVYIYKEGRPAAGYMVLAQDWDTIPISSEKSHLVLDQKDGEFYVKELLLGSDGLVLGFSAPRSKK